MIIDILITIGVISLIGGIIAGIILLVLGFRGKRILGLIRAGWIILGVIGIFLTLGFIELCIKTSLAIVFLIMGMPLVILVGLIITLTFGIAGLANKNYKVGVTFLIINLSVATAIIVLLVLFMTGIIPIRLM